MIFGARYFMKLDVGKNMNEKELFRKSKYATNISFYIFFYTLIHYFHHFLQDFCVRQHYFRKIFIDPKDIEVLPLFIFPRL